MSTDDAAEGSAISLLQTNEAVLAKLVRESPIAIIVSALVDGHILDVNDRFLDLCGYSRDEVIGQTSVGLGLWADPLQRAELMSSLVTECPLRDFEAMVRTKSGAERQVLATVEQVTIDDRACLLTQMYDVTAYRQVESRFRALVEQLPVITYTHGLGEPLTVTYISPQVETILGYTPDEVLAGQPEFLESRTHPQDQKRVREEIERTLRTLSPFHAEYRLQARDGHWVWLQDKATLVHDAQGQPLLWQGVIADISEQRRAEAALHESEERIRTAFEHAAIGMALVGLDGRFLQVNAALCTLIGYSAPELLTRTFQGITHPDDLEVHRGQVDRLQAGEINGFQLEKRYLHKNGRVVWARLSASLVRDERGSPVHVIAMIEDVTARKQAEEDLRASEAKYRALVEQLPAVVYILAADELQTPMYFSSYIEEVTGETPEEALALAGHWLELVHPEDRERVAAEELRTAPTGEIFRVEYRHRRKDGSYVWVRDECVPFRDEAGQIVAWQGVMLDISERMRAEEALRQSEDRFRSAFDHAAAGMALIAQDGRFLQVNRSLCAMLACSEAELLDASFADMTLAEDRSVDGDLVQQLLRGEITSYQVEKRLVRKPDEVIWGRLTVSLVCGPTGEPLYFVAQIQDITSFKAAGAALRESEERFRSAFDLAPIGKSLIAQDGRYMQVNRALCELVGYSEEELLAKTFHDITHPEDVADHLELHRRLWAGEIDNFQMEKRYLRKDGSVVLVHLTGSIVRDADGPKYAIAQVLDISDRRRVDIDRAIMLATEREYTRRLRALTEMRADLTAMIAHELRAPVAALRMMTFLLSKDELSSRAEGEMFAAVDREIEQLDRLINDVADVTTAEREDFSVQLNPIPLNVLFENAAAFGRVTLGAHPFTVAPAPNESVWCDAERISQVLHNLLDNVTKHTPPGTPVELRAHREHARIRIEVVDHGPGLPAEDVASIFEKFGRGHQAAARQTPGAGLGLYLSRQIVRAHGTELTVASTPGSETIFAFDLKAAP